MVFPCFSAFKVAHIDWVSNFQTNPSPFLDCFPAFWWDGDISKPPPWLWTQLTNEDSLISKGPWDIIIDNGSSAAGQMLFCLFSLWNTLAPGGVYIIQNLHANFGVNEVAAENPGSECWPGCCRILWPQLGSLNSKTMQLCNFATRWYPADLRRIHDLQSTCLHPIVEMVPCNCNMPFTCLLHATKETTGESIMGCSTKNWGDPTSSDASPYGRTGLECDAGRSQSDLRGMGDELSVLVVKMERYPKLMGFYVIYCNIIYSDSIYYCNI